MSFPRVEIVARVRRNIPKNLLASVRSRNL